MLDRDSSAVRDVDEKRAERLRVEQLANLDNLHGGNDSREGQIGTNVATDVWLGWLDVEAVNYPYRFYRALPEE